MGRPGQVGRAALAWIPLLGLAFANALLREALLLPAFGPAALPLSGLLLALLVLGYAWLLQPWLRAVPCTLTGAAWLLLTLAFEFPFAHYVLGTPWPALAAVLDVGAGNLMLLVLVATAVAPCLAARWRPETRSHGNLDDLP